jgi:hypothetical protein
MQAYVQELVDLQQARVQAQLLLITNAQRHLLAVRGYVRHAARINARWAMTAQEELDYQATPEYETMQREKRSIQRTFAASHRGYSLTANSEARSLNDQRNSWNSNDTVAALGQRLEELVLVELDRTPYPEVPTAASVETFRRWIRQTAGDIGLRATVSRRRRGEVHRFSVNSPLVATPGLSSHGRIRALDFVVKQGRAVIAGANATDRETAWRGPLDWQGRLNTAVNAVSSNWDGPLRNPDEPWHYTYDP